MKPPVIILVGGKSSRFFTNNKKDKNFIPKSLSFIKGKSILMNIIEHFLKHGFKKFLLPLGHYKHNFIKQISKEAKNKIKINNNSSKIEFRDNAPEIYFVHTLKKDNKAVRVLKCLSILGIKNIVVTYGDALGNVNLNKMNKLFHQSKKMCLAAGYHIASQYGHFAKKSDQILFEEKPIFKDPINIGFFFLKKETLKYFKTYYRNDLEGGILKKIANNKELEIYFHKGFWKSVDTYKEYEDLKKFYEK